MRTCANRWLQLSKNHKTIFDKPPSWSDADDSLESMSDPEEDEEDMPDNKDSPRPGVGDGGGDGNVREDEEDSPDDFFHVGEGTVIDDHLSLRAASESDQSRSCGDTEDDPVRPVTPCAVNTNAFPHNTKLSTFRARYRRVQWTSMRRVGGPHAVSSYNSRACTARVPTPTKSSSSATSRKRKEARVDVPFPSSVAEGVQEDRLRRVLQMSTVRGHDGRAEALRALLHLILDLLSLTNPTGMISRHTRDTRVF
jgi:hypothetical protein